MGFYVEIDSAKCEGCGKCAEVCPNNMIEVMDDVARVEDPYACSGGG